MISWLDYSKEKGIYFYCVKRFIDASSRIEGKQSLIGSIYSADLTPQRTILIECTPMVCISRFTGRRVTECFTNNILLFSFLAIDYVLTL